MQLNETSSSPEAVLSSEVTSMDLSSQLMNGPPAPPSQSNSGLVADTSVLGGFDQFFSLPGSSTDASPLTQSSPGVQSLSSTSTTPPAPSLGSGSSDAPWTSLPPLSLFNPNAIIPKSGSEVSQFGSWYVFPQRQSPTGAGARGSDGQLLDLSNNKISDDNSSEALQERNLLGNERAAAQLELDLLSPERTVYNTECRIVYGKRGDPLHESEKF